MHSRKPRKTAKSPTTLSRRSSSTTKRNVSTAVPSLRHISSPSSKVPSRSSKSVHYTSSRALATTRSRSAQSHTTSRRGFATYNPSQPLPSPEMPLGDNAFTTKSVYGCEPEMTYGGALSFLRRKYSREVFGHGDDGSERADVVVTGVPFDSAVTYRSGARLGPRAIREASVQLAELLPYPWSFQPFNHLSVIDGGDVFLDPHNPLTMRGSIINHARSYLNSHDAFLHKALDKQGPYTPSKAIRDEVTGVYGNFLFHDRFTPLSSGNTDITKKPNTDVDVVRPPRLLTFGGDHFITYPLLQAHAEKYGQMALIHFDAHCDTWNADGDSNEINHGTMFRHAANEGLIDPSKSLQIGLRTVNDDYMGFNILDAIWVHKYGPDAVLEKISTIVGESKLPVYLTFDIDCLDPSFAPGTGTPVPGGLSSYQALHIIRGLKDTGIDVVGADVVEVSPAYDTSEITGLAAAHVATDLLCMWADKKRNAGIGKM